MTQKIKDYKEKKITHSVLSITNCYIIYKARRYQCLHCKKTFYENNPFTFGGKFSVVTVSNVLKDLKSPNATFTDVAKRHNISPTSAINIFDRHVHISRRPLPECVAFDEVYAFKSYDSDYVCVIVDYLDKKIIDVLPSRHKNVLLNYFMLIPRVEREKVKYVSFDMWNTYRIVAKHVFPNCICIVDHFHMIQDLNKRVDKVRIRVQKKYKKKLWRPFCKAINQYELVKPGDKIAVCISGGKDSMLMAKLFQELKRHNKFEFELVFMVMDPGYNQLNRQMIIDNSKKLNIPIQIFDSQIFDSVFNIEKSPCYLCARMRRGHLYAKAKELGCNKIALGHHYDDVIETILMGMLYGAQVQTMMPKLHSTNFEGMELIRPMYLIREDDIKHWRDYNGLHFIQCACKFTDTCTTCNPDGVTKSKRMETKQLIAKMKEINPYVESNIFKSVENVNLKTIIAYKKDGVKHSFLDTYDQEN